MSAGNKCVIVLAPNGRRQTVKVTPNTTILQVLEEVCIKQGFKPEEYDVKHHNHVLDTTSIMRFSGLPNNAQLEMAKSRKMREESSVTLGLQLESGTRLMGSFIPTDSLWKVIRKLCPDEADPDSNPVIIYMRQEVSGLQDLEETTLRSLGLTGGRAMLRFVHRTPEELHHQANVSGPLPQRTIVTETQVKDRIVPRSDAPPEHPLQKLIMHIPNNTILQSPPTESSNVESSIPNSTNNASDQAHQPDQNIIQVPSMEMMDVDSDMSASTSSVGGSVPTSTSTNAVVAAAECHTYEEEILLLGERNAIVFSLDMAQSLPYEDLPDDFFDLTLEDARALFRDLKRKRAEMDETPLATKALRELDESKRVLTQLNQYRRAVLRVQFPDQTVLQGTFTPLETISTVIEFVRGYLDNPAIDFYLYTTPPKCILSTNARLVDANCVPSVLVHFGTEAPGRDGVSYLRAELLTRFTSPTAAAVAACHSRGLVPGVRPLSAPVSAESNQQVQHGTEQSTQGSSQGASTSRGTVVRHQPQGGPSSKVPKWFRPGK